MKAFHRIANNKPLVFTLLILLIWMVLAGLINGFAVFLLKIPLDTAFISAAGNLAATLILLIIVQRLGWFHKIGITNFGSPSTWLITLALAVIIIITGFFSFFKDIAFSFNSLYSTQEARNILLRSLLVSFTEETVFRGVLLYALVRTWGKTKRGIVSSVIVQAALFGLIHSLQVLAGVTPAAVMANVLDTFMFAVITGAVVLLSGTFWPAIVLHFVSNAFILIKGLSTHWVDPIHMGYLQQALLESIPAVICLWIALKKHPVQTLSRQRISDQD